MGDFQDHRLWHTVNCHRCKLETFCDGSADIDYNSWYCIEHRTERDKNEPFIDCPEAEEKVK